MACAWIERGGKEAAEALATSRSWPILLEMNAEGDYPEVVWQYADALNGNGDVPAGKPGVTVEESYRRRARMLIAPPAVSRSTARGASRLLRQPGRPDRRG